MVQCSETPDWLLCESTFPLFSLERGQWEFFLSPFLPFFFLLRASLLYWDCLTFLQIVSSVLKHLLVTEMKAALFCSVRGEQNCLKFLPTIKPLMPLMACHDVQLSKWNLLLKSGWSLPSATNCLKAEHTSMLASLWICIRTHNNIYSSQPNFTHSLKHFSVAWQSKGWSVALIAQCLGKCSTVLSNLEEVLRSSSGAGRESDPLQEGSLSHQLCTWHPWAPGDTAIPSDLTLYRIYF